MQKSTTPLKRKPTAERLNREFNETTGMTVKAVRGYLNVRNISYALWSLPIASLNSYALLVGYKGVTLIFVIKGTREAVSKQEMAWMNDWKGDVHVVRCVEDAHQILINHPVNTMECAMKKDLE